VLAFSLSAAVGQAGRVLAIGCHADDIEIGCGGTLLALTRARPGLHVTWVVLAAPGPRAEEAQRSASAFLVDAADADVRLLDFRESFLPYVGADVKEAFETFKDVEPDLILTHTRHDLHQDHRLACELTWNTFRDHLILEYEIPKYDGDLRTPNVFVPVSEELAREKAQLINEAFASQQGKHWFDQELFLGLMRLRGMEAASASGYAEAFVCRKLSLLAGPDA
jgi:LmbE family N-acetylglucosaminyl deacetylase